MEKKLFRNEHSKMIAGVASGAAEYLSVDVTIVRLLFVLSTIFLAGTGIVLYIVMWIIVPVNPNSMSHFEQFFKDSNFKDPFSYKAPNWTSPISEERKESFTPQDNFKYEAPKKRDQGRVVTGLILLIIGSYFLLDKLDIVPHWFSVWKLWPLLLIGLGLSIVLKSKEQKDWQQWQNANKPAQEGEEAQEEVITPTAQDAEEAPANDTESEDKSSDDIK